MTQPLIKVSDISIGYDDNVVLKNISFNVNRGDVFAIMGPSGCGKSTLLRAMVGIVPLMRGSIFVDGKNTADYALRDEIMKNIGVLFQGAALFTSMTVGENIALPLHQYTDFSEEIIREIVDVKLSMVGLSGIEDMYPTQLSGGMKKRVGLARALAADPSIVFFDEPSAGLDPIAAGQLDDLILQINQSLGTTIVIVSHDLDSLFGVANDSIFLDPFSRTITGRGAPRDLLHRPPSDKIQHFLTRGKK